VRRVRQRRAGPDCLVIKIAHELDQLEEQKSKSLIYGVGYCPIRNLVMDRANINTLYS
jgi:hypothetical protein